MPSMVRGFSPPIPQRPETYEPPQAKRPKFDHFEYASSVPTPTPVNTSFQTPIGERNDSTIDLSTGRFNTDVPIVHLAVPQPARSVTMEFSSEAYSAQVIAEIVSLIDKAASGDEVSSIDALRKINGELVPCPSRYKAAQGLLYDCLSLDPYSRDLSELYTEVEQCIDEWQTKVGAESKAEERIQLILKAAMKCGASLDESRITDNFRLNNEDGMERNDEYYVEPVWLCAQQGNLDGLRALHILSRDIDSPMTRPFAYTNEQLQIEVQSNHSILFEICDSQCYEDDTTVLNCLIELGANVNVGNAINTPLSAAVRSGKVKIVKKLLDSGAKTDELDKLKKMASSLMEPEKTVMLSLLSKESSDYMDDSDNWNSSIAQTEKHSTKAMPSIQTTLEHVEENLDGSELLKTSSGGSFSDLMGSWEWSNEPGF